MRKVEVRVRIQRPVAEVYAYTSAAETMPEWRGDVTEAEQLTEGPLAVGTRIRASAKALGRPIGLVVEVTELEPGVMFGYRPVSGPLRTHNVYTFEPDAGGTLTDEIEMNGIAAIFEPLMARMVRHQYAANLVRLKAILEAQVAQVAQGA